MDHYHKRSNVGTAHEPGTGGKAIRRGLTLTLPMLPSFIFKRNPGPGSLISPAASPPFDDFPKPPEPRASGRSGPGQRRRAGSRSRKFPKTLISASNPGPAPSGDAGPMASGPAPLVESLAKSTLFWRRDAQTTPETPRLLHPRGSLGAGGCAKGRSPPTWGHLFS